MQPLHPSSKSHHLTHLLCPVIAPYHFFHMPQSYLSNMSILNCPLTSPPAPSLTGYNLASDPITQPRLPSPKSPMTYYLPKPKNITLSSFSLTCPLPLTLSTTPFCYKLSHLLASLTWPSLGSHHTSQTGHLASPTLTPPPRLTPSLLVSRKAPS